jgi:hypothetical protein
VTASGTSSGAEQLRLSDAERDEAARLLGEHYAAGRLTADEHEQRTGSAYAARVRGDLPALFADLPGGSPWSYAAPTPAGPVSGRPGARGRGARSVPGVLRLLIGALLAVLVLTHLPWILLGLLALVLLTRRAGRTDRRRTACHGPAAAGHR